MPVIAALVAIGGAVLFAGVSIAKAIAKANQIDTDALDASRQVQRQLDRALPREIVVGTSMTGGVGAFNDAYGPNNEFGVAVTVLSAIPITGFNTLVVDGDRMTLSGDPTQGWVYATSHFLGIPAPQTYNVLFGIPITLNTGAPIPRLYCRVWLGDNNDSLGVWLNQKFPSKFSTSDKYVGCAVLVTVAENTNDDIDDEGENYIPFQSFPTIQSIVQGVEVCDPRNGGVYGDTSTYTYSANVGLVEGTLDYGFYGGVNGDELIVGNGYAVGLLDTTQIGATATYCDTRGYVCSGRIRSASQEDLTELRKCFNGVRIQSPASVSTIPQGARPPIVTIDMALYPYARVTDANRQGFSADVYNKARTLYREPTELYGNKDLPVYSKPEWVAEDNGVPRELDIELKLVPDGDQAFKLQKEIMYIGRAAGSASILNLPAEYMSDRVLPSACRIQLQNARPSWLNDKIFTLESKRRTTDFDVNIALREYAGDDVFGEPEPGEPGTPTTNPVVTRDWEPRVGRVFPDGVAGSFVREVGGVIAITDIDILGRGLTSAELDALSANVDNVESGGGTNLAISFTGAPFYSGPSGSSRTTAAVTANATGGSGTYSTYLWEIINGHAFTINSPNSATTTFTTNVPPGATLSAQARCTVTDSNGGVTSKIKSVTAIDDDEFGEDRFL